MQTDEMVTAAREAARGLEGDVFVYNGEISSVVDLNCINEVYANRQSDTVTLFLTTNGGNPDAGYRLSRYFQDHYTTFRIVVSGMCKSAGTLIALGAHEIAFTPYGELGPLDIQHSKVDKVGQSQSGLTIQDALLTLEEKATDRFQDLVRAYIQANDGLLSFESATKAVSSFVTQLYAPVMARIDPEEVGDRHRSMRIADDYGKRLSVKSRNLRPNTLKLLIETYPSHSFVIDQQEAATLFHRVRSVTEQEASVVEALGPMSRFVISRGTKIEFHTLHAALTEQGAEGNADPNTTGSESADVADPDGAAGATDSEGIGPAANDEPARGRPGKRKTGTDA